MLFETLTDADSIGKVRLLFGARQTGKTQLLRHVARPEDTVQYNLQDTRLRRRLEADPGAFGRELRALPATTKKVIVDEVQKVPDLLEEVQSIYDSAPGRFDFFLTGSSARKLRKEASNLLPGRSHLFRLGPVTRWETAATLDEGWPFSRPPVTPRFLAEPPFPDQSLARALAYGNLPGIWHEPDRMAGRTLTSYVETYLEEEIRQEAAVRDLGAFSVFLRLVALESGRPLNLSGLSQESGVAASTLKNFCDVLVDTFVAHVVPPYSRPGRKQLLTTPRFLLFDLGVRNAAAALPLDERLTEAYGGDLLEQWVLQELITRAASLGRSHRVTFWRTRSGAEVDAVYECPEEDVPIEVKFTERPRPQDARHLETFLDTYPARARRGLLICRAERPQMLTDRVLAMPWNRM